MAVKHETAVFAAGCFWGVQAAFDELPGVISTTAGYAGGHVKNPTYKQVCTGTTGHAESVEVLFDPKKTSFSKLLDAFWKIHDPTTPNRQGPDVGEQYRSAIFYASESQKKEALASKAKLDKSGSYSSPIVTQIAPAGAFYAAEDYHQDYLRKNKLAIC